MYGLAGEEGISSTAISDPCAICLLKADLEAKINLLETQPAKQASGGNPSSKSDDKRIEKIEIASKKQLAIGENLNSGMQSLKSEIQTLKNEVQRLNNELAACKQAAKRNQADLQKQVKDIEEQVTNDICAEVENSYYKMVTDLAQKEKDRVQKEKERAAIIDKNFEEYKNWQTKMTNKMERVCILMTKAFDLDDEAPQRRDLKDDRNRVIATEKRRMSLDPMAMNSLAAGGLRDEVPAHTGAVIRRPSAVQDRRRNRGSNRTSSPVRGPQGAPRANANLAAGVTNNRAPDGNRQRSFAEAVTQGLRAIRNGNGAGAGREAAKTDGERPVSDNFTQVRHRHRYVHRPAFVLPKRNTFAGLQVEEELETVVVGDSIVRHQKHEFVLRNPQKRKVVCLPGATVERVTTALDDIPTPEAPAIICHAGTNDVRDSAPTELLHRFKTLIQKLKARSSKVAMTSILPRMHEADQKVSQINRGLADICREEGVLFVDIHKDYVGRYDMFMKDGIHLNDIGNARLGRLLNRANRDLHQREELPALNEMSAILPTRP